MLESVLLQTGGYLTEGFLACADLRCGARYPVIEGIPIVLQDMAGWWQHQAVAHHAAQTMTGPMSDFCNNLQSHSPQALAGACLRSVYLEAHYHATTDQDPGQKGSYELDNTVFWQTAQGLSDGAAPGRGQIALDMGCSTGRFTFELARRHQLAVGLDINFDLLRCALEIQRRGAVDYQRRIHGRCFQPAQARFNAPDNVVFMVADAMDPPFKGQAFDMVCGLNILDNVSVPLTLLGQMDALLRPDGRLVLGSPYDWNTANTDLAQWLEYADMTPAQMVVNILTGRLFPQTGMAYAILEEHKAVPWALRQHDRLTSLFQVHMLAAQKPKPR
jgi:SAM-dependent methyltransferase/uncharacterized protein YbaR (Trm112 family)